MKHPITMLNDRRKVLLSAWIPAAICVLLIATSSSDAFSSESTSSIFRPWFQDIFGPVSNAVWVKLLYDIRKTGHFFGYGFVSVVFFRAWRMTFRLSRAYSAVTASLRAAAVALLSTLVVSSADEFHQSFLPKRTGSPFDVLLDMCGAVTCHLVLFAFVGSLLELASTTSPAVKTGGRHRAETPD
ncbi:MAG: VanZ family protein [Acidobacteriaceae bacterium]